MKLIKSIVAGLTATVVASGLAISAQATQPATPQGSDAAGVTGSTAGDAARGPSIYPTYEPEDDTGFISIFDGKTMKHWDGDPTFWRAENGELIGETTPDKVVKLNNFLIWRGGKVKDSELRFEFKLGGTNSGIRYRSVELPDIGKWVLKGYQAE